MFEFTLFIVAILGAFVMVRSLADYASQPKMKAQPIKVEKQKTTRRPNKRYP